MRWAPLVAALVAYAAALVLGCLADAWPLRAAWVLLFCALVWRLGLLHPPRQDDNRARTSRTPR